MNNPHNNLKPSRRLYSGLQNLTKDFKTAGWPIQTKGCMKIAFQGGEVVKRAIHLEDITVESSNGNVAELNIDEILESEQVEYPLLVVNSPEMDKRNVSLIPNVFRAESEKSVVVLFHSDVYISGEVCLCYGLPIKDVGTNETPIGLMEGETQEKILANEQGVRVDTKHYDSQKDITRRNER